MVSTESLGTPAELFMQLWAQAVAMSTAERLGWVRPAATVLQSMDDALQIDDANQACAALEAQLILVGDNPVGYRNCLFAIMQALDEMFLKIHPRTQIAPSRPRLRMPQWLRDMRDQRATWGFYAENAGYRLIARGPLLRTDRVKFASSGELLPDHFSALAVVARHATHRQRPLRVAMTPVSLDAIHGVPLGSKVGDEKVVFLPVAEQADDIAIVPNKIGPQWYATYALASHLDVGAMILNCLASAGACDIALAPELLVNAQAADVLAQAMSAVTPAPGCRLLLAGSGASHAQNDFQQPWNESRAFNQYGAELWRQHKNWAAGVDQSRAKQYRLPDPGPHGLVLENNAEGDTVIVADLDGLGRCLILICQDFEADFVPNLIAETQPDWVFVPILDQGISYGRWTHQRSFALSGASHARFLVVSSTALAQLGAPGSSVACGLAIGPKNTVDADGDKGRMCKLVSAPEHGGPGFATLTWRSDGWHQTVLEQK